MFPSLLLITTLYRLGVNISSTRQILLHANAGKIIFAFGNFVVGGNYVVGGVIFLIITIVQFIVVVKGRREGRRGRSPLHFGRDARQTDVDRRRP